MTVQELIDALIKVKDKTLPVYYYYFDGNYGEVNEVEVHEDGDGDVMLFGQLANF